MVSPYFQERQSLTYFRPRGRSNARLARARSHFTCIIDDKGTERETADRAECCQAYGKDCGGGVRVCWDETCPQIATGLGEGGKFEFPGPVDTETTSPSGPGVDPISQLWATIKPYFEGKCNLIPNFEIPFPCGYLAVGGVAALLIVFSLRK